MAMKNLKDWETQIIEYLSSVNSTLIKYIDSKEKYYGFEVIDGKLIMNPEILFIGINPGSGSGIKHHDIIFSTERISYLDIFTEDYKYSLAEETVSVFKLIGLSENEIIAKLENNSVKTNLYNIITKTQSDIKTTFNNTPISFKSYYQKSTFFCVELIKLIQPKIVIFEGKSVYNDIIEQCFEEYNSWNNDLNIGHYFSEILDTHFIGYTRTFSNINSKQNLANELRKIL